MYNFTELNELPIDVPDELGEMVDSHMECPGVFYVATNTEKSGSFFAKEYYIVTDEATMISPAARAYGEQIGTSPILLVYDLGDTSSGKYIIEYEVLLYKIKNHLPLPEDRPIQEIEAFGRETHPDYFGTFSVPQSTPWGRTSHYKTLTNGIYWIETDTNQKVLAICRTMQDDLSDETVSLSYDSKQDLEQTTGYMFFSEKDSCVPLFELLEPRAEWQNCINILALKNAIFQYYFEYALIHNAREAQGLNDHLGNLINSIYGDYEPQVSMDRMISFCDQAGTKFLDF